jgi:hypothetical protein
MYTAGANICPLNTKVCIQPGQKPALKMPRYIYSRGKNLPSKCQGIYTAGAKTCPLNAKVYIQRGQKNIGKLYSDMFIL